MSALKSLASLSIASMSILPFAQEVKADDYKTGFYVNVLEKIVCGILFYIIIVNNYNLDCILKYIFVDINNNIKLNKNEVKILENVNYSELNNHVLLNNFKKIFDK